MFSTPRVFHTSLHAHTLATTPTSSHQYNDNFDMKLTIKFLSVYVRVGRVAWSSDHMDSRRYTCSQVCSFRQEDHVRY